MDAPQKVVLASRAILSWGKVVDEDLALSEKGGVQVSSTIEKDGRQRVSTIRKVSMKQIDRRKKLADNEAKKAATQTNLKDKSAVKRVTNKKEPTSSAEVITRLRDGQKDLDSIVDNLRDPGVVGVVQSEGSALKRRIHEMRNAEKAEEEKEEKEDEPEKEEQKTEEDLDSYLKNVVALPKVEDGTKIANAMKPYLQKVLLRNKRGINQDDINKVLDIVERDPIDYKNIAMLCPEKDSNCPHLKCPFKDIKKIPTGEKCPVELAYIDRMIRRYLGEVLLDEDDVLGAVEYNLVVSVVDCDVTDLRIRGFVTQLGYLIEDLSVNPRTGDKVINQKINPIIELMKANDKRKNSALRQLLATPEIRERLNVRKKREKDTAVFSKTAKDKKIKGLLKKVSEHREIVEVGSQDGNQTNKDT